MDQPISVQFKMVSMCLEKPTYAPTQLSEVPPALPVKQFQCSSEWWWPSLIHWPTSPQYHCHYMLAKQLWQCGRECRASSPLSTSNTSAHPTLEPITKGCTTTVINNISNQAPMNTHSYRVASLTMLSMPLRACRMAAAMKEGVLGLSITVSSADKASVCFPLRLLLLDFSPASACTSKQQVVVRTVSWLNLLNAKLSPLWRGNGGDQDPSRWEERENCT